MYKVSITEVPHRFRRPLRVSSLTPRVLAAGDDPAMSSIVCRALHDAGYRVTSTRLSARMAEHLRKGHSPGAQDDPFELLVLDASTRPWVALGLLEAVRRTYRALPTIVITDADPQTREEAARLGAEAIIAAPVVAEELQRAAEALAPPIPDLEADFAERGYPVH